MVVFVDSDRIHEDTTMMSQRFWDYSIRVPNFDSIEKCLPKHYTVTWHYQV